MSNLSSLLPQMLLEQQILQNYTIIEACHCWNQNHGENFFQKISQCCLPFLLES